MRALCRLAAEESRHACWHLAGLQQPCLTCKHRHNATAPGLSAGACVHVRPGEPYPISHLFAVLRSQGAKMATVALARMTAVLSADVASSPLRPMRRSPSHRVLHAQMAPQPEALKPHPGLSADVSAGHFGARGHLLPAWSGGPKPPETCSAAQSTQ